MLEIGTQVEDFEVKDQNEQSFKLSAFRGKKVLLSFHPLAWTSICEKQMKSLEANQDTFESLNTVAVGVSVDSVPCKKHGQSISTLKEHAFFATFGLTDM